MAGERKPMTGYLLKPLHAYKSLTVGGGALTNSVFKIAAPTKAGVDLDAAGDDREYRVEAIHMSLSVATTITITDGTTAIWGPHVCPEGFGRLLFPTTPDKSRSGMTVGENKSIYLSTSGGVDGEIDLFGYVVPAV